MQFADELETHRDVAPLVAPTQLQAALVGVVQVEVVVCLEQHVAELGVGDALVGTLEARLDGLLGSHLVDGEVLAHLAQELDQAERAKPLGVVEQKSLSCSGRRREVQEAPELAPYPLEVCLKLLARQKGAFVRLATGIADETGAPAGEKYRAVAGHLEAAQGENTEEMADMEAVGGRVEPGVSGQVPVVEHLEEGFVAELVDEAAKFEVSRDLPHGQSVPLNQARGRLRPRARCGEPGSPYGQCERPRPPARAGRHARGRRRAARGCPIEK